MRKIPFAGIELTSQRVRRLVQSIIAISSTGTFHEHFLRSPLSKLGSSLVLRFIILVFFAAFARCNQSCLVFLFYPKPPALIQLFVNLSDTAYSRKGLLKAFKGLLKGFQDAQVWWNKRRSIVVLGRATN